MDNFEYTSWFQIQDLQKYYKSTYDYVVFKNLNNLRFYTMKTFCYEEQIISLMEEFNEKEIILFVESIKLYSIDSYLSLSFFDSRSPLSIYMLVTNEKQVKFFNDYWKNKIQNILILK